jgi:hypothetical protein
MGGDAFQPQECTTPYLPTVSRAFKEYLDNFMKLYLDDFTIFNDLATHFTKLQQCFEKCREYDINLEKCIFMVFSRMIFEFIISKEGKLLDPKKVEVIVNMPISQNPHDICL